MTSDSEPRYGLADSVFCSVYRCHACRKTIVLPMSERLVRNQLGAPYCVACQESGRPLSRMVPDR
jgi:hypothetical protein